MAHEPTRSFHPPSVAIVTRSAPIRRSLRVLLESADLLVTTYSSAGQLMEDDDDQDGNCVILDCDTLPSGTAVEDVLITMKHHRSVILLAGTADLTRGMRQLASDIFDLFEIPFSPPDLLDSVRAAVGSGGDGAAATASRAGFAGLTEREREILDHLVQGRSAKLIGKILGISPRTVEVHRAHIMDKLSARNLVDLVRIAMQQVDRAPRSAFG